MQQEILNSPKKKTICFVIPNWATKPGTGGAELQCFLLSEEFLRRGWKVEVLFRNSGIKNFANREFYNSSIRYITYSKRTSKTVELLGIFFMLLRTRSYYYYKRTDARILRGTCGLYCHLFGKKMIVAIANDSDITNTPVTSLYTQKKRTSVAARLRFFDAALAERIVRKHVFRANSFITQTKYQRELLQEKFGITSEIIPNSYFSSLATDQKKENILLWVANIRPQKQPHLLKELLERLDLRDWQVRMIGNYEGYENILAQIKSPNFKALGVLKFEEVQEWFRRSRILFNTSSSEGFPNTFIQAWFSKTLVISYEFEPDNLFSEKKLGFCANRNLETFVEMVQRNIDKGPDKEAINRAFEYARDTFSLKRNVDTLLSNLGRIQ